MSLKILLIFLCTFLLVQSTYCKALTSAKESSEVKTSAEDSSPVKTDNAPESSDIKLLLYVLGQFLQLADTTLTNGKQMFREVVADISALENKNKEVSEKLGKYKNFLNKIEKLQTETLSEEFTGKFDMMIELSDLVESSNTTSNEKSMNADKLFDESLKKHGLNDLEQEFEEKFEEFSKAFIVEATKIIDSRTVKQWPGKVQVQEWLDEFKTEHNVEKRMGLFEKFFDLFD